MDKTQTKLLARADRDGLIFVEHGIERGKQGGKFRPYGVREMQAATALIKAGLIERIKSNSYQTYAGGYASLHTEHTFKRK